MSLFNLIAVLMIVTAAMSYLNHRYSRLDPSIGVMLIAILVSLAVIATGHLGLGITATARRLVDQVNFGAALLDWMLGFLLFAGALTIDVSSLARHAGVVALLSIVGTAASAALVGLLAYVLLRLAGIATPLIGCMLFGALISPTDPVAVVGVMRRAAVPRDVQTIVSAESLFNDGVAVVLFLTLLALARGEARPTALAITLLLLQAAGGGIILGLLAGWIASRFLRHTADFSVSVMITLALAMGAYSAGALLHVSGPIAVVVAGLFVGQRRTTHELRQFWGLVDELLNAVLFVLMGLQALVMGWTPHHVLAAVLAIPAVLVARWLSVVVLLRLAPASWRPAGLIPILVWGGMRGGLAIAMALALPPGHERNRISAITYGVVVFSVLVQGSTIRALVRRVISAPAEPPLESARVQH